MKILVCISKSPDTTSKISFTVKIQEFDETGVQYIVNPYDEWYALVRAPRNKRNLWGDRLRLLQLERRRMTLL